MACSRCGESAPAQLHTLERREEVRMYCSACLRVVAIFRGRKDSIARYFSKNLLAQAWAEGEMLVILREENHAPKRVTWEGTR